MIKKKRHTQIVKKNLKRMKMYNNSFKYLKVNITPANDNRTFKDWYPIYCVKPKSKYGYMGYLLKLIINKIRKKG